MQKNTSIKYITFFLASVFVVTCGLAAIVHLIVSFVASALKHNIYYINPIRFLGINDFWPKYQNSGYATLIAWSVLISLYFVFLSIALKKYDPTLISRVKKKITYNKETKRLIYETKNATEIEVVPLTKLITQVYKLKDLLYRVDV